ncbi:MAG TPA: AraC family transcriptional regulator [Chryseolinea sp.]|nr:AraC family transcriptional regulator [Chryseolinea sp.]
MRDSLLITLVGGLSVFNSLFFAILLLSTNHRPVKNKLLAVLFLSLSMRVGKSLLIVWFHHVPDSVPAIGLLGMVATGPLLFLYIREFTNQRTQHLSAKDYLPFIPVIVVAALLLLNNDIVVLWLYILGTAQLFVYVALSWTTSTFIEDAESKNWTQVLTVAIAIIGLVFASQIVIETPLAYFIATMTATVVLYGLLFAAFRTQRPFMAVKPAREPDKKLNALATELTKLMEAEQIFKESNLTLSKVAARLGVKPYVISQAVSICLNKTFPEWVNEYRIREAERLLKSPKFSHYSIEGIAFESGFSTPSAFYVGFKKLRGVTPTTFKERTN